MNPTNKPLASEHGDPAGHEYPDIGQILDNLQSRLEKCAQMVGALDVSDPDKPSELLHDTSKLVRDLREALVARHWSVYVASLSLARTLRELKD
ncbi:MAG: hypothetical protein ACR2RB_21515 [Gammaproteobacteria bacterium]